ncbi:hypothetical protein NUM3379_35100 [Kineococcus sp. NUM-3379]
MTQESLHPLLDLDLLAACYDVVVIAPSAATATAAVAAVGRYRVDGELEEDEETGQDAAGPGADFTSELRTANTRRLFRLQL